MKRNIYFLLFPIMLLMPACQTDRRSGMPLQPGQPQGMLFEILSPEQTGIDFENRITENLSMNGLFYEYYYNGSGVAVADFNNDGFQDVYFVSNLHPNKLYLNTGNLRFRDISGESGASKHHGFATGVTTVDINSDGLMDIYISNSGKMDPRMLKNELFVNQGVNSDGIPVFTEKAAEYNLDVSFCSTQAAFFDFDLDNDLDMFLICHFPDIYNFNDIEKLAATGSKVTGDRLFENRNGKYYEISEQAGLINNRLSYCLGLGVSDLNNDGWPDVYVSNDYSGKDFLYMNNGNGTFNECLNEGLGHVSFSSMGNCLADFNNDGWSDIVTLDMMAEDNYGMKASYSSIDNSAFNKLVSMGLNHQYMFNTLQMNNGVFDGKKIPVFSDVGMLAGISATDWSWGPLLFDMDNDGLKDLFVANGIRRDFINNDYLSYFEKQYRELIGSHRISRNEFISSVLGRMPERKKGDYFFRNKGDLTFEKMNGKWTGNLPTCSNGTAYADFDNDGDLDLVINNSGGASFIYRNLAREKGSGNFLDFRLIGPDKNFFGIGARITIRQNGRLQVQDQNLTRGYLSSVSPVVHFGIGQEPVAEEVRVAWPDGKEQVLRKIAANQVVDLKYEEAEGKYDFIVPRKAVFTDVTKAMKLDYKHRESEYDDFAREPLLLHRLSDSGPGLAVADVNNDGLDDFFVGGAKGQAGRLYLQTETGFAASLSQPWTADSLCEDTGVLFFDADGDGMTDLYVASGSNEYDEGSKYLRDRLYLNRGGGNFVKDEKGLTDIRISTGCVKGCDFDGDGDTDLFVGGRQVPGHYPVPASGYILRNDSRPGEVRFTDVTSSAAPSLKNIGMITDAAFADINGDKLPDLILTGEWMDVKVFMNKGGSFKNETEKSGMAGRTGWWNCLASGDLDGDGDIDIIAGNLGLNCRFKASTAYPFELYLKDFDNNGTQDMVYGFWQNDTLYPLDGLARASRQLPFIRSKYQTFDAYARATLEEVYGKSSLKNAGHLKVTDFATTLFENRGDGTFSARALTNAAQVSAVNGIIAGDVDRDGNIDLLLAGNKYGMETETPRLDAGTGVYLRGNGSGEFSAVPAIESGLMISGDVRSIVPVHLGRKGGMGILAARNNGFMQLIKINE